MITLNNINTYIPQNLHVGFKEREATMDGYLSFPSYLKKNGTVAHQKSLDSWLLNVNESKNPRKNFINKAQDGFIVNSSVSRSGDFSSNRSMIRIYSPDGFEFEINVDNFCYIMEYADISKKYINCELIIGYCGGQLVLIPTKSPLLKLAQEYTAILDGETNKENFLQEKSDSLEVGGIYPQDYGFIYLGNFQVPKFKKHGLIKFHNEDYLKIDLNSYMKSGTKFIFSDLVPESKKTYLALKYSYSENGKKINRLSTINSSMLLEMAQTKHKSVKKSDVEIYGEDNFINTQINLKEILRKSDNFKGRHQYNNLKIHNIEAEKYLKDYFQSKKYLGYDHFFFQQNYYGANRGITHFQCFDESGNVIIVTLTHGKITVFKGFIQSKQQKFYWELVYEREFLNLGELKPDFSKYVEERIEVNWDSDKFNYERDSHFAFHPNCILDNLKNIPNLGTLVFSYIENTAIDTKEFISFDIDEFLTENHLKTHRVNVD